MKRQIQTWCTRCGADGFRQAFATMNHADFCWPCMQLMVDKGYAAPQTGPWFDLLAAGEAEFPGLKVVAQCAWDGSPIYQRWIDDGTATLGATPTCPWCKVEHPSG